MNAQSNRDGTLRQLVPALLFTIVTVAIFGIAYPLVMTLASQLIFPKQAGGSIVDRHGVAIGSDIVGQQWSRASYFHGRPSAAGNGYDPTATGGTNLAPTSKKLIEKTAAAIAALKKENPDATVPVPMDLVTASASGIDPDISPQSAYYQAPRVAKARGMQLANVDALVDERVHGRTWGFLGEPRVNVLELNLALDATK